MSHSIKINDYFPPYVSRASFRDQNVDLIQFGAKLIWLIDRKTNQGEVIDATRRPIKGK